ncbi:hypothetical protein BH10PSE14_BH10PSE14_04550 [soil metagenome]
MSMFWSVLAVATFNLVCAQTTITDSFSGKSKETRNTIYRLDLDRKIYCSEDCKATFPIAKVDPTKLWLRDEKVDSPSEHVLDYLLIDRETGQLSGAYTHSNPRDRMSIMIIDYQGQCERADFTGFPTFQTKF